MLELIVPQSDPALFKIMPIHSRPIPQLGGGPILTGALNGSFQVLYRLACPVMCYLA